MNLDKAIADLRTLVIQHGWSGHNEALAEVEKALRLKAEGDVLLSQARAIIVQQQAEIKRLRPLAAKIYDRRRGFSLEVE